MTTPLQVLILEDRAADAELMVRELEKSGFKPDWQRVETEREFSLRLVPTLDLILSDYTLPGFNALGALEILKASRMDTPFIVVSGSLGDDQAAECIRKGATDYLLKDRLARLGPAIERALEDRRNRRARIAAEEGLRRSEEQMRGVLTTVEDMVFSLSLPDYQLAYLNPAAEKLFGRPVKDFMADRQLWLQCVHPEDRSRMLEDQQAAIRWGTRESEFRIVRPDGSIRHAASRVWSAFDPGGKPVRLEGIVTDTTDRKLAEEERIALELSRREGDRLLQLSEFKSQFINMVAHDLNNVVTPMKFSLYALKQAADEGKLPDQAEPVALLNRGLDRLTGFLADLLDSARLQSGKLAINPSSFDLSAHLVQAADALKPQAKAQGIRVECDVPAGIQVQADARRIEQVTSNLLGNALKFTPAEGRIRISLSPSEAQAEFTVSDTGAGLRPEDIAKLFQPFSQIGNTPQGKHTGTGLGLFICRGIIERHEGKIWCESEGPGKGAAFHVALPRPAAGGPSGSMTKDPPVPMAKP
jgi:PAS domain S-box-containing protein